MVPGFVGLMVFGEWADAEDAPVLASVMTVVMVALLAVLAAGAVWFGVQARKLGARAGLVPAILSGLAAVYFLVLFVAQWLGGGGPLGGLTPGSTPQAVGLVAAPDGP
jgi:hypothetical protein